MKIAIFTDNDFEKTNGVTTTLRAVLRCAPADLQPRVYTLSSIGCAGPDYLALNSVGTPIPWYGEMRMYAPRMRAFRRHLQADGAALIHITTPGPVGLSARYLSARLRLPRIGSFHTQLAEYTAILSGSPRLGHLMNVYMRWLYGGSAQLLVPSEDTRAQLTRAGWQNQMAVWPRGVDADLFSPVRRSAALREQWRVCDRRPAILYAGRLSLEKGLALLPPLESALHRAHAPYRLIVAGEGPMLGELRSACPDAVFLGRLAHADVAVAMASADLFIFPSSTETAGNVVLEAQACGLPVLVADRGGAPEQMQPGQSGFVCRAGDVAHFSAAAVSLLKSPGRRTEMSTAACAHAATRRWKSALEPLFTAYRAAAAAHARPRVPPLQAQPGVVTQP